MKNSVLPVSKKFYSDIRQRVENSLRQISSRSESIAMTIIDNYLAHGSMPDKTVPAEVSLTFLLLKTEIDKAVRRSKSARERGRLRREQRQKSSQDDRKGSNKKSNKEKTGATSGVTDQTVMVDGSIFTTSANGPTDTTPAFHTTARKKRNKKRRKNSRSHRRNN